MAGGKIYYTFDTIFGKMIVVSDGAAVAAVQLAAAAPALEGLADMSDRRTSDSLTDRAAIQLDEYFNGKRRYFDIPINPQGTPFRLSVWNALMQIPYGETRSYKQVAREIGNPDASRAVGMANNKNPIMIIIPCHRVVGSNGSLVGYAGGLDMKKGLLELESAGLR